MSRARRRRTRFSESDGVNPMDSLSNLSDVMLCLAVGIMLALIIHWNVDISTSGGDMSDTGMTVSSDMNGEGGNEYVNMDTAAEFSENDMEQMGENELTAGDGMDRFGEVYYDASTGTYYVVKAEDLEHGEVEAE